MGVISNSAPAPRGRKFSIWTPLGTYRKPIRIRGRAGVLASADSAGTMASRSGRASAAPAPRRKVRRGNDRFVMIIPPPPRAAPRAA